MVEPQRNREPERGLEGRAEDVSSSLLENPWSSVLEQPSSLCVGWGFPNKDFLFPDSVKCVRSDPRISETGLETN